MLRDLPRPLVIAHRGDSRNAPENTLAAFELAIHKGAPAIELDAKLTADGEVVVMHDATVDRTTDGHGAVSILSLAEIRRLDAGSKFSADFAGEHVPTLAEVFETAAPKAMIDIELSDYAHVFNGLTARVVDLIHHHGVEKRVFFTSFHPAFILQARRLAPEIPAGLIALPGFTGRLARSWIGELFPHEIFVPNARDASRALVVYNHRRSRVVFFYTVEEEDEMRPLAGLGADGLITDDPQLAIRTLGQAKMPVN